VSADLEKARQYRERAEEIRIMASDKRGAAIRDSLQSIAATYDRLAENSAKSRPMAKLSFIAEGRPQKSPATLGDVLYAKSKARVPEQHWATLVQSIAAGDQLALHALYERAHRIVFTLIMRITANRETAEELTIDVFHDVWRSASRYDAANGTVLGWIMNQARSRAIDRLRFESRKKRSHAGDVELLDEVAADPRDLLEQREQVASLRAALAVLTPDERHAIETTFFGGLTHAEAAARLNQPLGTIKTRIRSGLHKLRHALAAEEAMP
jgi:RNA polymerase sigma-70 factor (ECF subfamily)